MPTIVPLLRGRIIILVQSLSWGITCVVSYYHSGPQRQYKNICLSAIIFMTEGLEFPFQSPSRFIQAHKKENMATTQLPFPFFSFEIENVELGRFSQKCDSEVVHFSGIVESPNTTSVLKLQALEAVAPCCREEKREGSCGKKIVYCVKYFCIESNISRYERKKLA